MIARLIEALQAAGLLLSDQEFAACSEVQSLLHDEDIADGLWLAAHMGEEIISEPLGTVADRQHREPCQEICREIYREPCRHRPFPRCARLCAGCPQAFRSRDQDGRLGTAAASPGGPSLTQCPGDGTFVAVPDAESAFPDSAHTR